MDTLLKTISISQFKAKCLGLLDRINATGEPLLVTKRGQPLARIVPARSGNGTAASPIGCMQDTASEVGDITLPVAASWAALGDKPHDSA